jgi:putative transposase
MPRTARNAPGGLVYPVLNRANGRLRIFKKDEDFLAFERVLPLAHQRVPIWILDGCLMSNHWHLVLWPRKDGELTAFMRWLTLIHPLALGHDHTAVEHGHLYQGQLKSFPIEQDEHLLKVLAYAERNPARAGIISSHKFPRDTIGNCDPRFGQPHAVANHRNQF